MVLNVYRQYTSSIWKSTGRSFRWLAYFVLISASDALDAIFWTSPYNKKLEDKPSESDQWDDAEIIRRYKTIPGLRESYDGHGSYPVVRICDDTVTKIADISDENSPPSEVQALNLVRANSDVLTPRVRRTVEAKLGMIIVMEYAEGTQLALCWHTLSIWKKLRIARILRQYIRQLQKIRHSHSHIPGPMGASPRRCDGYQFGNRSWGPFPDYASLSAFYNDRLEDLQSMSQAPQGDELFDDSKPLVFTHNDLNMRNILLGADGRVWLVDWVWSGFYPRWFEYQAMVSAATQDDTPRSWKLLIPFICGPYFNQQEWMRNIGYV